MLYPQEILDTTIKHSPGIVADITAERGSASSGRAVTVATAAATLARSAQRSVDGRGGDADFRAGADVASNESAEGADREADGGGDETAAAVAAAAEELAAAESHSLTQGAMKLVYLLAIQVGWFAVVGEEKGPVDRARGEVL